MQTNTEKPSSTPADIDNITAQDVQETLEWVRFGQPKTIHYCEPKSALRFVPDAKHSLANMANLGYELLQEIKAYRPDFTWKTSAAEIVGALVEEVHGGSAPPAAPSAIPPMTDPLGRHWSQPDRAAILLDETHALMDAHTFAALVEYSGTRPSGVYPGKMWRRHDGLYDPSCKPQDRRWLLCWFGEVPGDPTVCSNNFREILIVDEAPQ